MSQEKKEAAPPPLYCLEKFNPFHTTNCELDYLWNDMQLRLQAIDPSHIKNKFYLKNKYDHEYTVLLGDCFPEKKAHLYAWHAFKTMCEKAKHLEPWWTAKGGLNTIPIRYVWNSRTLLAIGKKRERQHMIRKPTFATNFESLVCKWYMTLVAAADIPKGTKELDDVQRYRLGVSKDWTPGRYHLPLQLREKTKLRQWLIEQCGFQNPQMESLSQALASQILEQEEPVVAEIVQNTSSGSQLQTTATPSAAVSNNNEAVASNTGSSKLQITGDIIVGDLSLDKDRVKGLYPAGYYLDAKGIPRTLKESQFFITVNENFAAKSQLSMDIRAELYREVIQRVWKDDDFWKRAIQFNPKNSKNPGKYRPQALDNDTYEENIKKIEFKSATIELGEKQQRLHMHIHLKVYHDSFIHLDFKLLEAQFRDLIDRVIQDEVERALGGKEEKKAMETELYLDLIHAAVETEQDPRSSKRHLTLLELKHLEDPTIILPNAEQKKQLRQTLKKFYHAELVPEEYANNPFFVKLSKGKIASKLKRPSG